MHDTLKYLDERPNHRQYPPGRTVLRMVYAYQREFRPCRSRTTRWFTARGRWLEKMPGDDWQRFANLRLPLLTATCTANRARNSCSWAANGASGKQWKHDDSLDWHRSVVRRTAGTAAARLDLNRVCKSEPATHAGDCFNDGFRMGRLLRLGLERHEFLRKSQNGREAILVICNFTPVPRNGYRVGVPHDGFWKELLNSDADVYWGGGMGNQGGVWADQLGWHGRPYSLNLTIPPLGVLFLPFFRPAYRKWLETTPWTRRKPLPVGAGCAWDGKISSSPRRRACRSGYPACSILWQRSRSWRAAIWSP